MTASAPSVDRMIAVADGLRLHVRDWTPASAEGEPVVCLAGLTRNLEDFSELAAHLSSDAGGRRRVVAISARGRGLSDRDPEPARYTVAVEANDVAAVMDALALAHGVVVGTSRGGLQAMTLAVVRPGFLRGVVLNDVGPVIEPLGLIRIRDFLAARTTPSSWEEAAALTERMLSDSFPALGPTARASMTRRTWREVDGRLEPAYDPALLAAFAGLDLQRPLPPLWPLFEALAKIPVMVIRGERSDILGAETVAEMKRRRPDLVTHEVPGEGHAPLLADQPTLEAIWRFVSVIGWGAKESAPAKAVRRGVPPVGPFRNRPACGSPARWRS